MARGWGNDWRGYTGPTKDGPPTAQQPRVPKMPAAPALPKYLNRKTPASDGTLCDSKTEARRWDELCLLQKAGAIRDLLPHPSFPLYVNGQKPGRITFDALYIEQRISTVLVVEDTKSPRTAEHAAYRQRIRLFKACYPHITFNQHLG